MQPSLPSITEVAQAGTSGLKLPALPPRPFVGLRPFDSEEALLYFGRREQIIELLQQLHRTHFVAIVGSSGCGKSSLVRAGLIPKLKAGFLVEDRDQWLIATLKPGDAPLDNLTFALQEPISQFGIWNTSTDSKEAIPEEEETGLAGFNPDKVGFEEAIGHGDVASLLEWLTPALDAADANLLLLVDQFEELFRFGLESGSKEHRAAATTFVELLLALSKQRELPIYVVLTMRSDFLGDCDSFSGLPEALNRSQYLVPRLTREQLRQAIEGPLHLFGGSISARLLERVLDDAGDKADQLPVLQHALMRTWEWWEFDEAKRRRDARAAGKTEAEFVALPLDLPQYEAAGMVTGALSKDADAAIATMTDEQRQITERIFCALTDIDENKRRIRPAYLSELCAIAAAERETVWKVIKRFSDNPRSFLTISTGRESDDPLIDISHESLIRQWKKLSEWMDAEDQARELYLRLTTAARRNKQLGTPLYGSIDLNEALKWRDERKPNAAWAKRYDEDFELALEFLTKSQKAEEEFEAAVQELEKEQEAKRKQELRRARLVTAVLSFALLLALGLAWYAYQKQQLAKTQGQRAARLYYDASMNAAQEEYERGNGARVYQMLSAFLPLLANGELPQTREFFWYHLWQASKERPTLSGHANRVWSVAFALDGKTLASASWDQTVKLWDVASGQAKQTLSGHTGYVYSVAFASDGKTLASASSDQTVKLWDVASGQVKQTLSGHADRVLSVAFASDGKTLASASDDKTVKFWDVASGQVKQTLSGHAASVYSVAFALDGKTLASASVDKTVKLWDVASGQTIVTLKDHTGPVYAVAFATDGRALALAGGDSAGKDYAIRLWFAATETEVLQWLQR
jgi:hypothetical protein